MTEAVNPLIAGAFALDVKVKNFHLHVYGPHFNDYHYMFDDQVGDTLESIDGMAEHVRKIGDTTIRSLGHISQLLTTEDDNDDLVSSVKMVERLAEDNTRAAKAIHDAIAVSDKNRDAATSNLLQDILNRTDANGSSFRLNRQSTGCDSPGGNGRVEAAYRRLWK